MNTEYALRSIIEDKLGVDQSEITNDASFRNDLGADSLDEIEIIMELEVYFNIEIYDDQVESIKTFGDALKALEERLR